MSVSNTVVLTVLRAAVMAALCICAVACVDKVAQTREQSLAFITDWFAQAAQGKRDDSLCHGLGLLKHKDISCAQMLEHAAAVDPATRKIQVLKPQDCFADVCGEFVEIGFSSFDMAGNEIRETAVLKKDEGRYRLYWYRSDSLLALLRRENPLPTDDDKDPVQVAYDEVIARYPSLYAYPPCYGVRASSTTLVGELMPKDSMDVAQVEQLAAQCGESFCFSLVGNKIATLCVNGN